MGGEVADGNAAGVTALTVDSAVLNIFWELASVQKAKREAAAKELVSELCRAQSEFEAGRSATGDAAPDAAAPLVSYSLRRLTRGLGSGREGARQGFALAFAGALAVLPCVSTKAAMDILQSYSEPITGSAKGAEAREIYLGKLFGYGAIVRAVREASAADAKDVAVTAQLAQEIASLARKKGYLREAGAAIILQLLEAANTRKLATILQEAPALAEWLFCPLESADAEALLLAVQLADRLPPSLVTRCALLPSSGLSGLFDKAHLTALLPALLSGTSAHPRVHSVWTAVVKLLAVGSRSRESALSAHAAVETFWDVACESSLFLSSHERKFLGFKVFTMLLPRLHPDDVPVLFSQQFMRCMVNSLTNTDTILHASASVCLSNLLAYVQSDAGAGLQTSVIAALQRFAGGRFDRLTHTGAISTLMESLAPESAEDYVGSLFSSFLSGLPVGQTDDTPAAAAGDDDEEALEAQRCLTGRRVWAIEQLCGLCRSPRTPAAVHFRVMRFLLVHAFFDFVPGGDFTQAKVEEICLGAPSPALALDVRQLCATRLFGLLADVLAAAQATIRTGGQAEPAAAEAAAAEATARKQRAVECAANLEPLLEVCAKAERAHAHVILAQPMQAEAAAVRKAVRALLPSLDRLAAADGAAARSDACVQAESARALLRVLLLLQLSAPQDYTPDMEDLPRCLQAASGLPATADEAAEVGVEPPHHMDVLVEVLLSLLAKPSAVLRDVVERVFRAFAVSITPEGVRSMLRVVTRSKGRRHSSAKDGSDDSDDDDSDDEESDEDEEEVEEDGDNDEDEDEDEAEEDSEPRKTQPQKAARDAAIDDGEDSDDGAGMEDDAMFKADAALAAVLSLSKAEKSKKKAAAEALTHFKFRVLSLLEMFIKAQPASPLLPAMVLPLLRALIAVVQGPASSGVLSERIAGLLVKSVCKAQTPPAGCRAGELSLEQLQSSFAKCLRHASRSTVPKVAKTAVAACQYLLRVLACSGAEGAAAVSPLARAALGDYFTSKKCRLPYSFFTFMLERFPASSGRIVEDVTAHILAAHEKDARNARDEFLTVQALKLTAEALRHKPGTASAAAAATTLQPGLVLRGATSALSMRFAKAKRQVEVSKQALRCADALRRFCAGQGIAMPAADVASLRSAAAAAKVTDPAPPPKVVNQLDRLLADFAAVATAAGVKRPKEAPPAGEPLKKAKR